MRTIDIEKATRSLTEYARESHEEPILVTTNGKPTAIVLPIENAGAETVSLSTNPKFLAIVERSRVRHATEGGISGDEMRQRLGLTKPRITPTKPKQRGDRKASIRRR